MMSRWTCKEFLQEIILEMALTGVNSIKLLYARVMSPRLNSSHRIQAGNIFHRPICFGDIVPVFEVKAQLVKEIEESYSLLII